MKQTRDLHAKTKRQELEVNPVVVINAATETRREAT
jgi:hypothetical protein